MERQLSSSAYCAPPRATGYALVDGKPGLVGVGSGKVRVVLTFTIREGVIAHIQFIADTKTIAGLDVVLVSDSGSISLRL